MTFGLFPSKVSPNTKEEDNNASTWKKKDEKALRELKRALREYYNGENIAERSKHLATLKMFGSWDGECDSSNEWEDEDVAAWRQFCKDMTCFEDQDRAMNRNRMFEQAESEIERIKANNDTSNDIIWPVAIVEQEEPSFQRKEDDPVPKTMCLSPIRSSKKKKKNAKGETHVDVVFVSQDKYRCAHGIEVQATPSNKVGDIYACQSLAKF